MRSKIAWVQGHSLQISDGSRSKFFDPGGLGQPFMVWVWIWKISPKNVKFSSLRIKKNLFGSGWKVPRSKAGQPLIYCRSKVSSGRVRTHLYFRSPVICPTEKKVISFFHSYILFAHALQNTIHLQLFMSEICPPYTQRDRCEAFNWKTQIITNVQLW